MKNKKIVWFAVFALAFSSLTAQQKEADFPEMLDISPWGLNIEGVMYEKAHVGSISTDNYSLISGLPEMKNTFSYSVSLEYNFLRADKLSYILGAGLDNKTDLHFTFDNIGIHHVNRTVSPFFIASVQYRNTLFSQRNMFSLRAGLKMSYYNGEKDYSVSTSEGTIYSLQNERADYTLLPSLLFSVGTSYNFKAFVLGLNITANIGIPFVNTGTFEYKTPAGDVEGTTYMSGNYIGLGLSLSPKNFCKKH